MPVSSRHPRRVRIATGHPVAKAWMAATEAAGKHAGFQAVAITAAWARAHGVPVNARRPHGGLGTKGGVASDGVLDVMTLPELAAALQTLSRRLRMPLSGLVLAAMAWHLGMPPGEYRPGGGAPVVLPPRAWPGAPDDDVIVPRWSPARHSARRAPEAETAAPKAPPAPPRREKRAERASTNWRWADRCPCCGMLPDDPERDAARCEAAAAERSARDLADAAIEHVAQEVARQATAKAPTEAPVDISAAVAAVRARCTTTAEERAAVDLDRVPESMSDDDVALAIYERTGTLLPRTSVRRRRGMQQQAARGAA